MSYLHPSLGHVMKLQLAGLVFAGLCGACGSGNGENLGTSAWDTTSAAPTTSTADLAGVYAGGPGADFGHLVLGSAVDASGNTAYFGDQMPGVISCTTGSGCTVTHQREDGTYVATATELTLTPATGSPRVYSWARTGETLSLTVSGQTHAYTTAISYCDTAADCAGERLIHPDCASKTAGWACNANACSFACWK